MATSYDGVATLMIEAGIGLSRLAVVHADPQCRAAHDLLQAIIGVVDDRAQDATEKAERSHTAHGIPAPLGVEA